MTHYLPPQTSTTGQATDESRREEPAEMADLRVFWGPEFCRIEYLVHLLETGRVKDEHGPKSA